MIFDIAAGAREAFGRTFDVCIAGGGPAGIVLARRLAGQGAAVALMEGGGLEIEHASQELYEGEIVGEPYFPLDITRLRYLGGSSNHWGGWCKEMFPEDFAPRPGDPWSGWPISKADLDPYQPETDAILGLVPAADIAGRDFVRVDANYRSFLMRHTGWPAVRFGQKYRSELAASDRISLGLHANLVDLRLDAAGTAVETAVFRAADPGSPELAVAARSFVLCLGGLENPRALLNATGRRAAGLGNEHDLVGRFFCEHIYYRLGTVVLRRPNRETINATPTPEMKAERGLPNYALQIPRVHPVLSLPKEALRSVASVTPLSGRLAGHLLGRSIDCEGRGIGAYLAQRRTPRSAVVIRGEQVLDPDSRVGLSEARDGLGLRRIRLDWRLTAADYRTMQVAATTFGAHLAERRLGRFSIVDWLRAADPMAPRYPTGQRSETGAHHHLCTTRMSDEPRRGVVDRQCRVHSVANLYLGGSSTFATGSWVNPTYTIVQLALRLGDHLGREIRRT